MSNPSSSTSRVWRTWCHTSYCPGPPTQADSLDPQVPVCSCRRPGEVGTVSARAPSLARVCSSSLDRGVEGQIMVWRESSWAAHYQSPLPASDTLFTEALGADSLGRRPQTQETALPSPCACLPQPSWALPTAGPVLDIMAR